MKSLRSISSPLGLDSSFPEFFPEMFPNKAEVVQSSINVYKQLKAQVNEWVDVQTNGHQETMEQYLLI